VTDKFHLAWFHNFVTDEWRGHDHDPAAPWDGRFYIELAKRIESEAFDFLFFEDTLMVSDAYGGTREQALAVGTVAPKHDPVPLVAAIASHTENLGLFATMSATFYPPYLLARLSATLDHIAGGRFGWNIVTSAEDLAAQNFGYDKIPAHDKRYEMADEYVDLVKQLWDSWEPDAYVADRERQMLVDHDKVHEIGFRGAFHSSRGPLNVVRSPQGNPVLGQAGASPRGRDFAAKHADLVLALGAEVVRMKDHRDDIRERATKFGRNPDDIKVMYLIAPIIAPTREEAIAKRQRWFSDDMRIRKNLEFISAITEIDFAQFDPDQPLPEGLRTEGEQTMLSHFTRNGGTLREMAIGNDDIGPFVGTPAEVADTMANQMAEVGGDGFLIVTPKVYLDHEYIDDILTMLVPELKARGLVRTQYAHTHLRDNLREF